MIRELTDPQKRRLDSLQGKAQALYIVELKEVEGVSHTAVAEYLGVSRQAINKRARRVARRKEGK